MTLATDVDEGHDQQNNGQREVKGGRRGRTVAGPVDDHRRVDDRVLDVQVEVKQTISGV